MSFWKRIFRRKKAGGDSRRAEESAENVIPVFHREKISMHNRQEENSISGASWNRSPTRRSSCTIWIMSTIWSLRT